MSSGLFMAYACAIAFGGWLANPNPLTLLVAVGCGFTSYFLIGLGLTGFLRKPVRVARVPDDRLIWKDQKGRFRLTGFDKEDPGLRAGVVVLRLEPCPVLPAIARHCPPLPSIARHCTPLPVIARPNS